MQKTFEFISPPSDQNLPLLVHIPHSSVNVPEDLRSEFIISDQELEVELLAMTDRYTDDLFSDAKGYGGSMFVNRMSRLVMDPERFPNDNDEPMSQKGMGAVYTKRANGEWLRNKNYTSDQRNAIMEKYFYPYSKALEIHVTEMLESYGKCFIVDGHSFPSIPLPYEDSSLKRPDICFGFDPFHISADLVKNLETLCKENDFDVGCNQPFVGSYVPLKYFRKEKNVNSLMIEIRRDLYMDELTGERSGDFVRIQKFISELISHIAVNLKRSEFG